LGEIDIFNKSCCIVKTNTTDSVAKKTCGLLKYFDSKFTESSEFIVIHHLARDSLIACFICIFVYGCRCDRNT